MYHISVRLVSEELKSIKFDNFDNSYNSFLWPEYFIDFLMLKMDPMSGCNIRLVFTLPPRDSTQQYKRCVHFWNNFLCITSLFLPIRRLGSQSEVAYNIFRGVLSNLYWGGGRLKTWAKSEGGKAHHCIILFFSCDHIKNVK